VWGGGCWWRHHTLQACRDFCQPADDPALGVHPHRHGAATACDAHSACADVDFDRTVEQGRARVQSSSHCVGRRGRDGCERHPDRARSLEGRGVGSVRCVFFRASCNTENPPTPLTCPPGGLNVDRVRAVMIGHRCTVAPAAGGGNAPSTPSGASRARMTSCVAKLMVD